MDYRYESDDFHKSLEPMVIINDDLSQEVSWASEIEVLKNVFNEFSVLKEITSSSSYEKDPLTLNNIESEIIQKIGPDVSIIPVEKKKPLFKIRLFNKEYSPTDDDERIHSFKRYVE